MTQYTERELRREAVQAIRGEAKAAGIRARFVGYRLCLDSLSTGGDRVALVAQGERRDGSRFEVGVAI